MRTVVDGLLGELALHGLDAEVRGAWDAYVALVARHARIPSPDPEKVSRLQGRLDTLVAAAGPWPGPQVLAEIEGLKADLREAETDNARAKELKEQLVKDTDEALLAAAAATRELLVAFVRSCGERMNAIAQDLPAGVRHDELPEELVELHRRSEWALALLGKTPLDRVQAPPPPGALSFVDQKLRPLVAGRLGLRAWA